MILPQLDNANQVGNERESIFDSTISIFLKTMVQIHINLEYNFTMIKQKKKIQVGNESNYTSFL